MPEHLYLISLGILFGTPLAIFGMKYWSATQQARARIADEGAYRALAEKAAATQSAAATSLASIQIELTEIKSRLAAVETILKTVG